MRVTVERLANELAHRFRADAARGLEMNLRLEPLGAEPLDLRVRDGRLDILRGGSQVSIPDVTFTFEDLDWAWDIMTGRVNAIDAFMQGRFRADGYLLMAFKLMEMFGSLSLPPTPND